MIRSRGLDYYLDVRAGSTERARQGRINTLQAQKHVEYKGSQNLHQSLRVAAGGSDREQRALLDFVYHEPWARHRENVEQLSPALLGTGTVEPVNPQQSVGVWWLAPPTMLSEIAVNLEHVDALTGLPDVAVVEFPDPDGAARVYGNVPLDGDQ